MRRFAVGLGLVLLAMGVAAAQASAGTVATIDAVEVGAGIGPGASYDIYYQAGVAPPTGLAGGIANGFGIAPDATPHHITFSDADSRHTLYVSDPGVRIISHTPVCTGGLGTAVCRTTVYWGFANVNAWGGTGADTIAVPSASLLTLWAYGGPGNDRIVGGASGDWLYPGGGADDVRGGDGYDHLELQGALDGEPGPLTVSLDDVANDGVIGFRKNIHSDLEVVEVSNTLRSTLVGNDAANLFAVYSGIAEMRGGGGNDTLLARDGAITAALYGGAGNDWLELSVARGGSASGGPGDDRLLAVNDPPVKQTLTCGDGADTAAGDQLDVIAADCETVFRP